MNGRFLSRVFSGRERQSAFSLSFLAASALLFFFPHAALPYGAAALLMLAAFFLRRKSAAAKILLFAAAGLALAGIALAAEPFFRSFSDYWSQTNGARLIAALRERIGTALGRLSNGDLYRAVLTGDASALSEDAIDSFRLAGVRHLLALSGLHVSFVLGFFSLLPAALPGGRRKNLILMAIALFYLVFTGCSASAARSTFMTLFACTGAFSRQKNASVNALFHAAVILLFFRRSDLTDPSFLLTFFATLGILLVGRPAAAALEDSYPAGAGRGTVFFFCRLRECLLALTAVLSANAFLFPLCLQFFRETSLLSPLTNLILVPLVAPLLAAGILYLAASALFAGAPFAAPADAMAAFFLRAVSFFGRSGVLVPVSGAAAAAVLLFSALHWTAFAFLRPRLRFLPVFLLAPYLFFFLWSLVFPA